MNVYIVKEYGHDDTGHEYIVARIDNSNEVYEGDYYDCDADYDLHNSDSSNII